MRKFIIDTDTASDDAVAIMLGLLSNTVEVVGITTVCGNISLESATNNALMSAEICDLIVPVYKGASKPLFKEYLIMEIDGMKILFIAIITEEVLAQTKSDQVVSTFLDVGDAANEVGKICDTYNTLDIDFTVLLTHIGFEDDKLLAASLKPEWGVDVIIGGHSHTLLKEPETINDILIVQAGVGTDQIGRFEIIVDTDTNSTHSYTWSTVAISEDTCPRDYPLEDIILNYKNMVDKKYGMLLTRLSTCVTHPSRIEETSMGNLFCDILRDSFRVDIALIGSGSLRTTTLGPIIRVCDLIETFPYDSVVYLLNLSGAQLKRMFLHILREEAYKGHTEFYQFSYGLKIIYNREKKDFEIFTLDDNEILEQNNYTLSLQEFHYSNMEEFLGFTKEEITAFHKPKILAASCFNVLEGKLSTGIIKTSKVDGRLTIT